MPTYVKDFLLLSDQNSGNFYHSGVKFTELNFLSVFWICKAYAKVPHVKRHIVEKLETYKDLFDNAHDIIHILDPEGEIIYVNNAWTAILGYLQDDIEGRSIYSFLHERDRDRFRQYRNEVVKGKHNNEEIAVAMITRMGGVVFVEGFVSAKIIDGKALYTRGIFRDVTARRQKETQLNVALRQLKEREANLHQLLFHAPDAIIVVDTQSKIRYWNPKAEVVFGWAMSEVLGRSLTEVIIPIQYRKAHEEGMKRYLTTGEQRVLNRTIEITALNKQSEEFYVALTISATMQNGEPAFVAFIRDIKEQKRNEAELEQKRVQLEQSNQKLEISNQQLEQFAHVASHDMKEPIRKILLFAERIQSDSVHILSEKSRTHLDKIVNSAERLADLVDGVLAYSSLKAEDLVVERIDLNAVVKNVVTDLEILLQQKEANVSFSNLPFIEGAPLLIHQLFYNLISNSLKFSKTDVPPFVEITSRKITSDEIIEYGLKEGYDYFEILVKDNGIGFLQEYSNAIFKTFSRLHPKEKFEGTGLGLSLCKSIVEKHHGAIEARGEEGVGATFRILLPEAFSNLD